MQHKKGQKNYKKGRTPGKSCYNEKKRKKNNTIIQNQKVTSSGNEIVASHQLTKIEPNNNRSLTIVFLTCGRTFTRKEIYFENKNHFI